jgi:rubredoxin
MRCECGTEMEFIGTNWICPKCSDVGKPVIVLPPGSKDFIKKKMAKMNAREEREELERIVESCKTIIKVDIADAVEEILSVETVDIEKLIQSILDAGFVRLDDIEIDYGKVIDEIDRWRENIKDKRSFLQMLKGIKGIIKMKEGKSE